MVPHVLTRTPADATTTTSSFSLHRRTYSRWQKFNMCHAHSLCSSLTATDTAAHRPSLAEQTEVEQHFIDGGMLLPNFNIKYWIGLSTTSWPRFRWLDPATPRLNSTGALCDRPTLCQEVCEKQHGEAVGISSAASYGLKHVCSFCPLLDVHPKA